MKNSKVMKTLIFYNIIVIQPILTSFCTLEKMGVIEMISVMYKKSYYSL